MGIAKEYLSGKAHIIIHDDYCVKTQEEIDEILDSVAQIYEDYFARKAVEEILKTSK